ncbi:Hpt domain-containing protein [Kosakonia sp. H02]|nr:Hpt domain-containing protein [Kosakonia sp. H02]
MRTTRTLLATFSAEQPCRQGVDQNVVIVPGRDALRYLHQQSWHALAIDLTENTRAGFSLLDAVLAEELAQALTLPTLLLACSTCPQTLNEPLLHLKGFDQLISLPLLALSGNEAPPLADLRELRALAGQQQAVIDAMIPTLLLTLDGDIKQLTEMCQQATLIEIAALAHRMKSSWHLLGMRRARRSCIIMERLPVLIKEGGINEENSLKMRTNFISVMFSEYCQLRELMRHYW